MSPAPFPWQSNQWQRLFVQLQGDRLAHAYLLTGEKGLGKHAFAIAAAQLLLCERPDDTQACGSCRSCELFAAGTNPDLMTIEPENSQVIKIDQVRELSDFSVKTSHGNRRKVLILDQADALNINAANALLKTLEEPPGSTVLFLITATPAKLLATIRSRCQRIVFAPPDVLTAQEWLAEEAGDQSDLETHLKEANYRPLLALQLLDGKESEERNNVIEALTAIFTGKLNPVEFAANAKNIGADKILEHLWFLTATSVKQVLTENEDNLKDGKAGAILQLLAASSRSQDDLLGRLLAVNQSVDEARTQLAGASNPNQQLLLESILWRWSRLLH